MDAGELSRGGQSRSRPRSSCAWIGNGCRTRRILSSTRRPRAGRICCAKSAGDIRNGCGGGDLEVAHFYTWTFYYSRRINTRYVSAAPPREYECSAAFIRDSREDGPLYGRNWDVTLTPWSLAFIEPPREGSDGKRVMWCKGVSCSVMLDEEPTEIFPVDSFALLPPDCRRVKDLVDFLQRYRDFWGPGNSIFVDPQHDSVAIERANCRMGVRWSTDGTSVVVCDQSWLTLNRIIKNMLRRYHCSTD